MLTQTLVPMQELAFDELSALRAENAKLRAYKTNNERILSNGNWRNASLRVAYALVQSWTLDSDTPIPSLAGVSVKHFADLAGFSKNTAATALQQLEQLELIERITPKHLCDSQRRIVEPRNTHPHLAYHWESGPTELLAPAPPLELPAPAPTASQLADRERQSRLRELARQVSRMACPCCGTIGELHIRCGACGQVVEPATAEPDSGTAELAPETLTPPMLALAESPADTTPDQPQTEVWDTNTDTTQSLVQPWDKAMLLRWLGRRIGAHQALTYQHSHSDPHKYLPFDGTLDLDRYLAGAKRHLYGSRPALADGLAWFISYDIDPKFEATAEDVLTMQRAMLARLGLRSVSFARRPGSWRLEIHFDAPVDALAAHEAATQAAPLLGLLSDECFPVAPGDGWRNRANQNYGWPLWWLDEQDQPQESPALFVSEWGEWQAAGIASDLDGMLLGLAQTWNSAALVPDLLQQPRPARATRPAARPAHGGGLVSVSQGQQGSGAYEEVRAAIADFCERHRPSDFDLPESGYFKLREENEPSARWDQDGYGRWIATDFGDDCRKYDLFDVHVLKDYAGNKRRAIADLMAAWRVKTTSRPCEMM
jgi:hypothetical protein